MFFPGRKGGILFGLSAAACLVACCLGSWCDPNLAGDSNDPGLTDGEGEKERKTENTIGKNRGPSGG